MSQNQPATAQALSVEFAQAASEALESADKLASEQMQKQAAVDAAVPQAVQALIDSGLIADRPEVRKHAAEALGNHTDALTVVRNVANEYLKARKSADKLASATGGATGLGEASPHPSRPSQVANVNGHERPVSLAEEAFAAAYIR